VSGDSVNDNANFYRCLPEDQLRHAVVKLERFIRQLRRGNASRTADSYQQALDLARGELERRRV
jgi:hypothetical protein